MAGHCGISMWPVPGVQSFTGRPGSHWKVITLLYTFHSVQWSMGSAGWSRSGQQLAVVSGAPGNSRSHPMNSDGVSVCDFGAI